MKVSGEAARELGRGGTTCYNGAVEGEGEGKCHWLKHAVVHTYIHAFFIVF